MAIIRPVFAAGAALTMVLGGAITASADDGSHTRGTTCSGTSLQSPGVILPGTYESLTVHGLC
ncbi:MAG: hypothetical protein M3024_13750, partial [Candidatus Dormibacteraeota bacterium]|nr:hypothetical protein [Candidatus Dormibacteraeota bacterium]